jgi:hypothetical protein
VHVVLDTEQVEVLDRVKSELRIPASHPPRGNGRCIDEAIVANDQLIARLDETLAHIRAFRTERAASAKRLRERRSALGPS